MHARSRARAHTHTCTHILQQLDQEEEKKDAEIHKHLNEVVLLKLKVIPTQIIPLYMHLSRRILTYIYTRMSTCCACANVNIICIQLFKEV